MPESSKKIYELVKLTSGKALVSASSDGNIQAIKADVELSMANKDIIDINGNPVITASGFDKLNKVAGVSLVMPQRIDVPGHGVQPNPFFITDPDTGGMQFVMAKMSAVGFSPVGNLAVVDQTLLFSLLSYFKMDCLAKIKKIPGFGKSAHRQNLTPEELKFGYFIPTLDKNYGIWMDTRHMEFMKVQNDHCQRQRFAERIALGILKRNCLRHHPAIGVMNVQLEAGGKCSVPILAWRKDVSLGTLRKIAEDTGTREGVETVKSEVITTEQINVADAAIVTAETAADTNVETGGKETIEVPKTVNEPSKREKTEIRIGEMISGLGEERWQAFYKSKVVSGRSLDKFSDDELEDFAHQLQQHCRKIGI
jgi:hypothetical protein